jgi:hypothetical protein
VPSTDPTWVIGELDDVLVGEQQVAGLDVAVHDAVAVGVVKAAAGLDDDVDRLLHAEVTVVAEQLGARVARDVLHHDEVPVAARVEAEIEHLHDVRVHEPGGGERFAPEPGDERRVVGEVLGEQLDRDVALEPAVERQVHGRHPAHAEPALDPVPAGDRLLVGHHFDPCPVRPAPPPPPLPFPFPFPLPFPLPFPGVGVEGVVAGVVWGVEIVVGVLCVVGTLVVVLVVGVLVVVATVLVVVVVVELVVVVVTWRWHWVSATWLTVDAP